jgi:hypothetical protein
VEMMVIDPSTDHLEEWFAYEAPGFRGEVEKVTESGVAQFVAAIAIILTFFITTAAWCWFVCRNNGGLKSCSVGWFTATATCKN